MKSYENILTIFTEVAKKMKDQNFKLIYSDNSFYLYDKNGLVGSFCEVGIHKYLSTKI